MSQLLNLPMRQYLRTLTLDSMKLTEAEIAPLYEFSGLQSLQLVVVRGRAFQKLSRLVSLRSLTTWNCEWVNCDVLEQIGRLQRLEHLTLNCCDQITDAGLQHLNSLTNLQSLGLTDLTVISEVGLRHLSTLTNLEALTLAYNPVTDEMCKVIAEHHTEKLRILDLDASSLGEGRITDAGLAALGKLSQLQRLKLGYHSFTPEGLVTGLSGLTNLETLSLESVEGCVTGDSLKGLSRLVHLRKLNFDSCATFNDAAMSALVHFTALEHLNIAKTMVRRGLSYLSSTTHPNLTYLDMSYSEKLDDAGLREIVSLQNLSSLHLFRCPKGRLTAKGTRALLQLPKLELLDIRECPIAKDVAKILRSRIRDMREDLGISRVSIHSTGVDDADAESEELPDSEDEMDCDQCSTSGNSVINSKNGSRQSRKREIKITSPVIVEPSSKMMVDEAQPSSEAPAVPFLRPQDDLNNYIFAEEEMEEMDMADEDTSSEENFSGESPTRQHHAHSITEPNVNDPLFACAFESDSEDLMSEDADDLEDDREASDRNLLAELMANRSRTLLSSREVLRDHHGSSSSNARNNNEQPRK